MSDIGRFDRHLPVFDDFETARIQRQRLKGGVGHGHLRRRRRGAGTGAGQKRQKKKRKGCLAHRNLPGSAAQTVGPEIGMIVAKLQEAASVEHAMPPLVLRFVYCLERL